MSNILVTTNEQRLHVTQAPIVAAQGVNEDHVVFTLDSYWSGFGLFAVFYRLEDSETVYQTPVDGTTHAAVIPHEVTDEDGIICFGLYGVSGNVIQTSEIVKYKIVAGRYGGEDTEAPTPGLWEQLLSATGSIEAQIAATNARIDAIVADPASSDTELVDVRTGYDGKTYQSAGGAVRGQAQDLHNALNRYADLELTPYTPVRGSVKTGFISTAGVENTTNTNYIHFDFDIPKGTKKIWYQPWNTYGTDSSYACVAYYDSAGNFLSCVSNTDLNNTSSTASVDSYEGLVPDHATKATITYLASHNQLGCVLFYGYYNIEKHTRTLNDHLSGDSTAPLYLQVTIPIEYSELNDTHLSLTARIRSTKTPISYNISVVGYDDGFTNRVICGTFENVTRGISGNVVDVNFNAFNRDNTLASKKYVGFLLNIKYEYDDTRPDYIQSFYRFTNEIVHDIEYAYINDVDVRSAIFHIGGETSNLNRAKEDPHNPLYGGRLMTLGDSLTEVHYKLETESWPYLIAKWNNMKLDNKGISGNPMAKPAPGVHYENDDKYGVMAERVDDLDANSYYTHIFVMGGANDRNCNITIGTNSDTVITTFKGAINHIIDTLIQKFPFAHIVFATTYQRYADRSDEVYATAMLELCAERNIPCLDNYHKSGVLMFNQRWMLYHGADPNDFGNKHLNAAGDAFVAPRFEQALRSGVL